MKLIPANSTESEETVLGGILVNPKCFATVAGCVSADDFYHPGRRDVFSAMVALDEKGSPIDAVTVLEAVEVNGKSLNALGGIDYLSTLMSGIITVENIDYHARAVRKMAERRKWTETFRELALSGYGTDGDDSFFSICEKRITELQLRTTIGAGPIHMAKVMRELDSLLHERAERKGEITGVRSGFHSLDKLTAGWQPGDLVIIGARPSMGKTSLMKNMMANSGVPSLIFSLEMSRTSLAEGMLSGQSGINSQKLRHGMLETDDWMRLSYGTSALAHMPIWIEDAGDMDIARIRSTARRWRAKHTKKDEHAVIGVDYLQLVSGDEKEERRDLEVAKLSRGLKMLAKELNVPVLALSQLGRGVESRQDKRPMNSDLRESGAIEQDADVISFIYRDEVYSKDECKDEDRGMAEIIVSKQRNGPTGMVRLCWNGKLQKFTNPPERK